MKCTTKALVAFAGGIAMISTAVVASPTTDRTAPVDKNARHSVSDSVQPSNVMIPETRPVNAGATANRGVPDTCATATSVNCGSSVTLDLGLASPGVDELFSCRPTGATNTLWASFVATDTAATVGTCNSVGTDSVINVFSGSCGSLVEIGCNEDACGANGFRSQVTVTGLNVGETYYVQVGAWGAGSVGVYTLDVECFEFVPCSDCAPGSTPEGEPTLIDGDVDTTNGGCNSTPNVFGSISVGETVCGTVSLYETDIDGDGVPNALRDTDWYEFTLTETTAVEWAVTGDGAIQALLVNASDCSAPSVIGTGNGVSAGPCSEIVVSATLAPGTYVAFAAFPLGSGLPNGSVILYNGELRIGGQTPGACCDFDGNCAEVIEADCDQYFTPNATCAEVTCVTIAACPSGALIEGFGGGEILFDGYDDVLNSGCNAPFGTAFDVTLACGDVVCGTSGNHLNGDGAQVRDQDWFQFDAFTDVILTAELTSIFPGDIFIAPINSDGSCPDPLNIIDFAQTTAGGTNSFEVVLAPGSYTIVVQTSAFTGTPVNAPYFFSISCDFDVPAVGCCFEDGSCTDLVPSACLDAEGNVQTVVCAEVTCPVIAPNDTFDGALPVNCNTTFVADLATANPGVEFPFSCGIGTAHTNSLWYSFVASDSDTTITTCGVGNVAPANDSTIDAYSFDGVNLTEIGCSEDDCAAGTPFNSTLSLTGLTVGETYYIRIAAWNAAAVASYNVELFCGEVTFAENDTFDGAIAVNCDSTFFADLSEASPGTDSDGFGFSCRIGGVGGTHTLWYSFVATETTASITTCNSVDTLDSIIDAFSFDGVNLVEIGCNDDDETGVCDDTFLSTLELSGLTVGETYFIRIGAWGTGGVAEYQVDITCGVDAPCDPTCADANGDGVVNLDDLDLVLQNFGQSGPIGENGDVNCDGVVNLDDLDLVLQNFGGGC